MELLNSQQRCLHLLENPWGLRHLSVSIFSFTSNSETIYYYTCDLSYIRDIELSISDYEYVQEIKNLHVYSSL